MQALSPMERTALIERYAGKFPVEPLAYGTVRDYCGTVTAVAVIVDRSGPKKPDFGCPFVSLIEMNVETFEANKLPPDLAAMPAVNPGSR